MKGFGGGQFEILATSFIERWKWKTGGILYILAERYPCAGFRSEDIG